MKLITIDNKALTSLFTINQFEVPNNAKNLVFVGIRGALPVNTSDNSFQDSQTLVLRDVDYRNLNCTIVQWGLDTGQLAVYAGSTVPSIANILGYRKTPPLNSNCLCPGYYKRYQRGQHQPANPAHWYSAFRQDGQPLIIRRTYDNTTYDNFDKAEVSTGCDDNIHAAWTMETDNDYFSSAGCQVIMGIPYCASTQAAQNGNLGPWKSFKDVGYQSSQSYYSYALFNSTEIDRLLLHAGQQVAVRLKFGATGAVVTTMQNALIGKKYLTGPADGDFGPDTFKAVIKFQTDLFGIGAADGVVGPVTAQALGMSMPLIGV